jgi:hypothetical protein
MSYKPPFAITADILNLVAEIREQVGRLKASACNAPVNAPLNAPVNLAGRLQQVGSDKAGHWQIRV